MVLSYNRCPTRPMPRAVCEGNTQRTGCVFMALRIGRVPYLHAEPFYFDMARRGMAFYELVPGAVAVAAANGTIDAGPVPLVDCCRLADRFEPVAGVFGAHVP